MSAELRQESRGLGRLWRTLTVAYWLGWQIESNWTDPFLFFIYSIARPLGAALILVFMYRVVAQGNRGALLGFFIIGTAFWPFVISGMQGMAWGIISDREHWRTLRSIYTSPISFRTYLVGRSLAHATAASAAVAVTLLLGRWGLGVSFQWTPPQLAYSVTALALGLIAILAMGLLVVSMAMSFTGDTWRMPEGVGAALYLVCGAIFPVTVLPAALRWVSQAIPLTWWLEAMRRGLLGEKAIRSFPWASDTQVLAILATLTATVVIIGSVVFGLVEQRARRLGILDRETSF